MLFAGSYVLRTSLLANEYACVKLRTKEKLDKSDNLTLNFDGWSDINLNDMLGATVTMRFGG
jgi:hypothetical protein